MFANICWFLLRAEAGILQKEMNHIIYTNTTVNLNPSKNLCYSFYVVLKTTNSRIYQIFVALV